MIDAVVKKIYDADTIAVELTLPIRFDFIDAMEIRGKESKEGLEAKEWLEQYISVGDTVQLDIKKFDMYERALAVVYKDSININGLMLKEKMAEVYDQDNHNNGKLD